MSSPLWLAAMLALISSGAHAQSYYLLSETERGAVFVDIQPDLSSALLPETKDKGVVKAKMPFIQPDAHVFLGHVDFDCGTEGKHRTTLIEVYNANGERLTQKRIDTPEWKTTSAKTDAGRAWKMMCVGVEDELQAQENDVFALAQGYKEFRASTNP